MQRGRKSGYAPVEMTILFENRIPYFQEKYENLSRNRIVISPAPACRGTGVVMGLKPPKVMKNASVQLLPPMEPTPFPLSSRAKPRDLQFRGPFVEKLICPSK
jgi:hypothetical protein